ncbi:S-adenosyl-L-methionine-dependent methyltransferase [Crassisporium funariophilum]|nr:S-adenosyl-L-methionine-dependent methyltransferase [Crassisporium funariophilum]
MSSPLKLSGFARAQWNRPSCNPRILWRPLHTQHWNNNPTGSHGSVNSDEIAHFSKLSSEWWDEQGEFSFLHKMNPVRMQFIRDKLLEVARDENPYAELEGGNVLKGLDVLDVGCGGGLLSESLARMGANTLGIDASEANIAIATLHSAADPKLSSSVSGPSSLSYLHAPAETLLTQRKRYDVVCSMEVLEHVDNPSAFLSTCAELLKPGGHLFLSTISRTPLAYALTILVAEDILRKVTSGTHTYSKFVKPSELVQYFRDYRSPSLANLDSVTHEHSLASRPWISTPKFSTYLPRLEAELRGLVYNPLQGRWHLAPRDSWGALECNYLFWVRKPKE